MAMDPELVVYITTSHITDTLTDDELFALNNVIQYDSDPRPVMGYEKAETLFTKQNPWPIMHDLVKQAFNTLVHKRMEAINK